MELNFAGRLTGFKVSRNSFGTGKAVDQMGELTEEVELKTEVDSARTLSIPFLSKYTGDNIDTTDPEWHAITVPLDQYNIDVDLEFDIYPTIQAKLKTMKIKIKESKDGERTKQYSFILEKECDKEDIVFAECYLNKKEEAIDTDGSEKRQKIGKEKSKFIAPEFNIKLKQR